MDEIPSKEVIMESVLTALNRSKREDDELWKRLEGSEHVQVIQS